jgi:hypothetical protein
MSDAAEVYIQLSNSYCSDDLESVVLNNAFVEELVMQATSPRRLQSMG